MTPFERMRVAEEIRFKQAIRTQRRKTAAETSRWAYCVACNSPCRDTEPDRFGRKPPPVCCATCANRALTQEDRVAGSYGMADRPAPMTKETT